MRRSTASQWRDFLASATGAARAEVERRQAAVTADDVADILFTSGTTGVPKGVVQTHGRTMQVASDWVAMTGLTAGDRYLMVNPYFHMFGLKAGILASVVAGATMLPEPVFDVDRVLARVEAEQVTVLPGRADALPVDPRPPRSRHVTTCRACGSPSPGAADIPVELIRRVRGRAAVLDDRHRLRPHRGRHGGGDRRPTTTPRRSPPRSAAPGPASSCASPTTRATTCRQGEPGEILLRGGSVMSHYLDDPEATAAVLSADGWLRTGDLGVVDERGCLRIVGRAKDMFIVGGFNAYPAEIENALLRHPDIQQAAVIGIPDERLGEVGMAFVVLRAGSTTTGDGVIAWARDADGQLQGATRGRGARRPPGQRHRQGRQGRPAGACQPGRKIRRRVTRSSSSRTVSLSRSMTNG